MLPTWVNVIKFGLVLSFFVTGTYAFANLIRAVKRLFRPTLLDTRVPTKYRLKSRPILAVQFLGQEIEGLCLSLGCPATVKSAHVHRPSGIISVEYGQWLAVEIVDGEPILFGQRSFLDGETKLFTISQRSFLETYEPDVY